MFLGEYIHTLDSKGRMTIPAKFRDQFATGLVVTRNPSATARCLLVYPQTEWKTLADRVSGLPLTDPQSAMLRRAFFSAAEDLRPDKQGRILINQRLKEFASIETDVIVAGLNTFVELWQPAAWEEKVLNPLDSGELDEGLFAALGV